MEDAGRGGDVDMEDENMLVLDLDLEGADGVEVRSKTLVGELVAENAINRNTIKSMIQKAWNMPKGGSIVEVGDYVYRFNFENIEDCNRILRGRPSLILGYLLIVDSWPVYCTLNEINLC